MALSTAANIHILTCRVDMLFVARCDFSLPNVGRICALLCSRFALIELNLVDLLVEVHVDVVVPIIVPQVEVKLFHLCF